MIPLTQKVCKRISRRRFGLRQGQTGEPVDVPDQEGHRQSRVLPLLLPMVDSGHLQRHFLPTADPLRSARWGRRAAAARPTCPERLAKGFGLLPQRRRRSSTRPSRSLTGYRPPRCSGPSGSCCCWAPSTVRSCPPAPPNRRPARAGEDAGKAVLFSGRPRFAVVPDPSGFFPAPKEAEESFSDGGAQRRRRL